MDTSVSPSESRRLEALQRYKILDTPREREFDDLVRLAAQICQTPMSLISLVDRDRQWFKGRYGLDITETPRRISFCTHTILHPERLMEVPDATRDPRFADNELVTGALHLRYYLGAPLVTPEGHALGTLCVLDKRPRRLTPEQKDALRILARQVMTQLELRRGLAEIAADHQRARTALQDQEARLRLAVETAELGMYDRDLVTNKVTMNAACQRILGVFDQPFPPDVAPRSAHPEDKERVLAEVARAFNPTLRETCAAEFRILRPDGTVRWVSGRGRVIFDDSAQPPRPCRFLGVLNDITERKEALELLEHKLEELHTTKEHLAQQNQELEREQARYQELFDFAPDAYVVTDLNGRISEVNQAACELLGVDAMLLRQLPLFQFIKGGEARGLRKLLQRFEQEEPPASVSLEVSVYPPRRPPVPCAVAVNAVRKGATGPISNLRWLMRDVTERKRSELALQRQALHLQLLHQAAAGLLLGQQPVDLLRQMHPQIAETFSAAVFMLYQPEHGDGRLRLRACGGVTPEEQRRLGTLRYGRAVAARPAEALRPIVATHIQTTATASLRFVRKLGFRSYLYYPLILNDRLQGTVAFASRERDDYDRIDQEFFLTISRTLAEALERQRLESELQRHARRLEQLVDERTAKLRETVADLEGFSYSLVHDLRAPLRGMQAYASVLEEEFGSRLDPQARDYLRKIKVAASRMDQLVTDSLNYSKLLHEELPLTTVNVGSLLRGLVETYPNLQPRNADIRLELEDVPVVGNEAALTQVFSNLLGNAVKFVPTGVMPRVRIWAQTCPPGHTLIWIEDNGIGIPKEGQQKIFGMFERMHRADEYPGTGIGLAIVKKSLERIGGQVCLESEPGKGSRFCVQLPLAPGAAAADLNHAA